METSSIGNKVQYKLIVTNIIKHQATIAIEDKTRIELEIHLYVNAYRHNCNCTLQFNQLQRKVILVQKSIGRLLVSVGDSHIKLISIIIKFVKMPTAWLGNLMVECFSLFVDHISGDRTFTIFQNTYLYRKYIYLTNTRHSFLSPNQDI